MHDPNLKLNLTSLKLCNFGNRKRKKREIKKRKEKKKRKERQKTRHQKIRGKLVFHKELNFHYWPFVKVISTQKIAVLKQNEQIKDKTEDKIGSIS